MHLSPERIAELQAKFPSNYEIPKESQLALLRDYDFSSLQLVRLTCNNHRRVVMLSKDPWTRSIHYIEGPNGIIGDIDPQCECPFTDLRVVKGN